MREITVLLGFFANDEFVTDTMTQPVAWIKSDPKKQTIKIVALPTRENAEPDINEQLIVEYYSR
jgi:ribosomal protein S4